MPVSLALEIYHLIIQHVDNKKDLRSLALTCSAFREEVQWCLFDNVNLSSIYRQTLFLSAINTAPLRLGPLVHTFHYHDRSMYHAGPSSSLAIALRAMRGLKHLEIHGSPALLQGVNATFQLHTLVVGDLVREEYELAVLLCGFLPTQNSIKYLKIAVDTTIKVVDVPTGLGPELVSLGVNNGRISDVLLGNAGIVSHFQWFDKDTPPPLTVYQLNHLKSFLFRATNMEMDTSFMRHLTALTDLYVHVSARCADDFVRLLSFLENLPRLHVLTVYFEKICLGQQTNEIGIESPVPFQRIFEYCTRLEYMHVIHVDKTAMLTSLSRRNINERDVLVWRGYSLTEDKHWLTLLS